MSERDEIVRTLERYLSYPAGFIHDAIESIVLTGDYDGHPYLFIGMPVPGILSVATAPNSTMAIPSTIGANYLLSDRRERADACARLLWAYDRSGEHQRRAIAQYVQRLVRGDMYGYRWTRVASGSAPDTKTLLDVELPKRLAGAPYTDTVIARARHHLSSRPTDQSGMHIAIVADRDLGGKSTYVAVRSGRNGTVRFYVYRCAARPATDVVEYDRGPIARFLLQPVWARWMAMRDRATRRKFGIGNTCAGTVLAGGRRCRVGVLLVAMPPYYLPPALGRHIDGSTYTLRPGHAGEVLYVMCGDVGEAIVVTPVVYDRFEPTEYKQLAIAPYPQRSFSIVPSSDEGFRGDLLASLRAGDACDVLEEYYLRRLTPP